MKLYKLFLTALLMLVPLGAFAQDGIYKTVDFSKPDPMAKKMMYEALLDYNKDTPFICEEIKRWGIKSISAFQVDLNDDGVNEVIGIHLSTVYMGSQGGSLFIMEKTENGYKNLGHIIYPHGMTFYVLNEKSNGYRKILEIKEKAGNKKAFKRKLEYVNGSYQIIFK